MFYVSNYLSAIRVARELRSEIAKARGDRQAELRASDEAVALLRQELCEFLDPDAVFDLVYLRAKWLSSLVLVFENEKYLRECAANEAISEADDAQRVQRVALARAEIIGWQLEKFSSPYDDDLLLEIADHLIYEASFRHSKAAVVDPQFDQEYTDYLRAKMHNDSEKSLPAALTYFLRRLEREGDSVWQLTQHELYRGSSRFRWSKPSRIPTIDDWREVYADELKAWQASRKNGG